MTANRKIIGLLNSDNNPLGAVGSPSDTFDATIDILEVSENSKLLGELACFLVKEGDDEIFVLGQITAIRTVNRWHEESSFKGIIKRHGSLPNLSEIADNRVAKISVQSGFVITEDKVTAHKLANSPSTGKPVRRISNEIMQHLVQKHKNLVSLGTAYDTDVSVPFWFKHFGPPDKGGSGDAYHIGVFGRTGSGKTTTAANMVLGYARHHDNMSILILDPQEQFYEDANVLPDNEQFAEHIKKLGMKYHKYKIPGNVTLPNDSRLFSELLLNYGFIQKTFRIFTEDKKEDMREAIEIYIDGRTNDPKFSIGANPDKLLQDMLNYFLNEDKKKETEPLTQVYAHDWYIKRTKQSIKSALSNDCSPTKQIWQTVCELFTQNLEKIKLETIINDVVEESGNVFVLNISGRDAPTGMDDLQTLYVKIIMDAIKKKGAERYSQKNQSNCLVVLDEAHRFISTSVYDPRIKELTASVIDTVRTTRKYGIGCMFITQTIDSLHEEIRRQIRISAFGYGLTSGSEFAKIKDVINDDAAAKFYRSFIDPSSNGKYPFMFHGPISPLSFTGAPLFLEMQGKITNFSSNEDEPQP